MRMIMNNYCYECGHETEHEICDICENDAFPVFPIYAGSDQGSKRIVPLEGVHVLMTSSPEEWLDRMFYCELEISLPSHWDPGTIKRLGAELDRLLDSSTRKISWTYRGGVRSLLRMSGMRTGGRCDWCVALRKSLQNLAKEDEEPFHTDCRCRPL
jgi:hypothetical protein